MAFFKGTFAAFILVAAFVLIAYNHQTAHWLLERFVPPVSRPDLTSVGELTQVTGFVLARWPQETADHLTHESKMIPTTSLLQSSKNSSFQVRLNGGCELEFFENSRASFELWNHTIATSPVLVSVLNGDFRVLKPGQPGQVFIVQDGHMLTPLTKTEKKFQPFVIHVLPTPLTAMTQPTSAPSPNESFSVTEAKPSNIPITLTNASMDEVLAAQKAKFSRCQANALRMNVNAKGTMVVGFRIANDGHTLENKIISASIADVVFKNCVLDVISDLKFNAFSGPEILRSFELSFD